MNVMVTHGPSASLPTAVPETVDVFESRLPSYDEGLVSSVAAASSGYVAVGGDGKCAEEPCPDAVATIWTSPDGRSWSRLPSDDRFEVADAQRPANHSGAWATSAVAWDSQFVVAGAYDGSPVVWISSTPDATATPIVNPTPSQSMIPEAHSWASGSRRAMPTGARKR